jgi:hypothetical protein
MRPVRQRNPAVLCRQPVVDHVAVTNGPSVYMNDPGDAVGPGVDRGVGDGAAAGVPDEYDFAGDGVHGIDDRDYRVDMITQRDSRAIGFSRLHAGQREGQRAMPSLLESRNDLVPRRTIEPEARDQDDVHTTDASVRASIFISEQSCRCR